MPGAQVSPPTILVVDDEEIVARLVVRYLAHIGYTVLGASSGAQALAIVQQRQPPIDLVLTDVSVRGMAPFELAAALLAECPGPQVILVAGPRSECVDRVDVEGRPVRVLRQPMDLDELQVTLQEMLPMLPPAEAFEAALPAD